MNRATASACMILAAAFGEPCPIRAAEAPIEEIVVTGSHIKGTPEDAALPVDVFNRSELEAQGDPSMVEMVRNLSYSSGSSGEAGFEGSSSNVANLNLRGLGFLRTLVLLNGKRFSPDVSSIPRTAIGRVEVLKDGGAVVYGSDAMAGVVNFITRSRFEGLELRGSYQYIDGSDGQGNLAAIGGTRLGRWHGAVSAEWDKRSRLTTRDRDWAIRSQAENPEGGWSIIGQPGFYLPALAATPAAIVGAPRPDPQCDVLGSETAGPVCLFQYTNFFDLVNEQETLKLFAELEVDLSETLTLYADALVSRLEVKGSASPSYPPNFRTTADRWVAPSHPGLADLKAKNPDLFPDVGPFPGAVQGAFPISRALGVNGVNGEPGSLRRKTDYDRLVLGITGSMFRERVGFDLSLTANRSEYFEEAFDEEVERMAFAIDGLGGPDCVPSEGAPGVGPCQYFNPFSNAIERSAINGAVNPQFDPALANSPELLDWLLTRATDRTIFRGYVLDAVFDGTSGWNLGGGAVGWAAGVQARRLEVDARPPPKRDRALNPCPFNDPFSIVLGNTNSLDCAQESGLYAFGLPIDRTSSHQNVWAVFAELDLSISDRLDLQAALRYEEHDGDNGSTLDPKLAVSWRPLDWLTLRGSISTTFAAPQVRWLVEDVSTLQFVTVADNAPGLVTTVNILGNPALKPESALASNLGFVIGTSRFRGSLDWWRLDVDDPFHTASGNQLMQAYRREDCADGGSGVGSEACDVLRTHVLPEGTAAPGVQRIVVNRVNGTWELTEGLDFAASYRFDGVGPGALTIGTEGTYTFRYDSGPFIEISGLPIAEGGEFAGLLNWGVPFTPKPKLKGSFYARYRAGNHRANLALRYVDDYRDASPSTPDLERIDDHLTLDVSYGVALFDALDVSLSVFNLTDEDPPRASTNLNYDPYTHASMGRMIKLGLVYRLAMGR